MICSFIIIAINVTYHVVRCGIALFFNVMQNLITNSKKLNALWQIITV